MSTTTAPFPKVKWPHERDIEKFYGRMKLGSDGRPTRQWEAENLTTASVPYHLKLSWDESVTIRKFTCHRVVRTALETIFEDIWNLYGKDLKAIDEARMNRFGGCYNFRPKRFSNSLSLHSYGAAVDLDPARNPAWKGPKRYDAPMPEEVVNIFKKYGFTWGGDWTSPFDPMHFEATRSK